MNNSNGVENIIYNNVEQAIMKEVNRHVDNRLKMNIERSIAFSLYSQLQVIYGRTQEILEKNG